MAIIRDTVKNAAGQDVVVYIEVDEKRTPAMAGSTPHGNIPGAPGASTQEAFKKTMELIHVCAEQIANSVHTIPEKVRPQEFSMEFAVKLDTELNAIIARSSIEAQFQVTLTWKEPGQ